jgi:twitching motility protein PilT
MIDVFPTNQQQQIRVQLAGALQGVVCQQLIPTADGNGRVVGVEIMMATPAVRNLIRDGKTHQIYSAMQAGGRHGMQTMDQSLADLVRRGYISYDKGPGALPPRRGLQPPLRAGGLGDARHADQLRVQGSGP